MKKKCIKIESILYYTRFGLQGFSNFGVGVICSLSILLLFYIYFLNLDNTKFRKKLRKYFLLIYTSTLFYSRVALLVAVLIAVISYGSIIFLYKKWRYLVYMVCIFFTAIIMVFMIVSSPLIKEVPALAWAFELFINYKEKGSFSTSSSDQLMDTYSMPSLKNFTCGDGRYTENNHTYMSTDVDYMRNIYFWGLLPTLIWYSLPFILFLPVLRRMRGKKQYVFFWRHPLRRCFSSTKRKDRRCKYFYIIHS